MAVRNFNGASVIKLAVGDQDPALGPYTFAFLIKRNSANVWMRVIAGHLGDNSLMWDLSYQGFSGGSGINRMHMGENTSSSASNTSGEFTSTTEWELHAFSCPGGFATLGRWHVMGEDGVWAHEAGTEPGSPLRGLQSLGPDGTFRIGGDVGAFLDGRIAIIGMWHNELSDSEVEELSENMRVDDWIRHSVTPASIWPLTQPDESIPVEDLLGNSDQVSITGTSVIDDDDPPGWDLLASPLPLDIGAYLSGGSANTNPLLSIGGEESVHPVAANLFDDSTYPETVSGFVDYRLIYIRNNELTRGAPFVAYIFSQLETGREIAIALAEEDFGETVPAIPDDITPPSGVVFSAPSSAEEGLSLGTLDPGDSKGLWIRRKINPGNTPDPTNPWVVMVSEVTT